MKQLSRLLLSLFVLLNSVYGQSEDEGYFFPKPIKLESLKCSFFTEFELDSFRNTLIKKLDTQFAGSLELIEVNIDNDPECELIHFYYDRVAFPNNNIADIYEINEKRELILIGSFLKENFTFAESDGSYLQILSEYFKGHKTNPIYLLKVYRFNGNEYVVYKDPQMKKMNTPSEGFKHIKKKTMV